MRLNSLKDKINDIIRLKQDEHTWKEIALALNSKEESVKSAYKRRRKKDSLPPKPKLDRSKIQGYLADILLKIVKKNPHLKFKELANQMKNYFSNEIPPSTHCISRFLKKKGYEMVRIARNKTNLVQRSNENQ